MNRISRLEGEIGIEVYSTKTEGIGGSIRQMAEDFFVNEITNRVEGDKGEYLIVELTKRDWDTNHLIRELSRILHVSQRRFGWAGTKDKHAVTRQKLSIWDVSEEDLNRINLQGVELKKIGYANRSIAMGDLYGNEFTIVIRDLDLPIEDVRDAVGSTCQEIKENGIANFFGSQRFGSSRPVTHLVGEEILHCDFEKAVMTYIAKPFPDESREAREAREYIWETGDLKGGLKKMPLFLRFERALLDYLIANPGDYAGSFSVLPKNLKSMFVHAYQSLIFNKILSSRIKRGIPIDEAIIGDVVCFKNEMGFPNVRKTQKVNSKNLDGINNLIKRGRAFTTIPIIGYETELMEGIQGDIERDVLDELGIEPDDFRIEPMPEFGSKGLRREIMLPVDIEYSVEEDETSQDRRKVELTFMLPKGSYATIVLREFMKNEMDLTP
ncbi:MAG: tRNA pseudouridine(13) synthase TruD [Halobacteriota archaeon]|nr:tRNA pseudouridine(13) synthase TruD [Halobacteriota archaeon]